MLIENIKKLCGISGISGDEGLVADEIISQIKGYCTIERDRLGNIIAFKKGARTPKNKIMIDAHTDEVGFIITFIEESGLLKFDSCGGIDGKVVVGKPVLVGKKRLTGLIGTKAIHQQSPEEKDKAPELKALYIDIGASSKAEAEKYVRVGDRVKFAGELFEFGEGLITAPALDDRAGCALIIELLKEEAPVDFYATFTVQEETGLSGAKTATYKVEPDITIAVETTTAGDIAGVSDDKKFCCLGKGAVVSFMDRATVYDMELYHEVLDIARAENIIVQSKCGVAGGNNSGSMQVARNGARAIAISMPTRYLHSPTCTMKKSDIDETLKLLRASIRKLSDI